MLYSFAKILMTTGLRFFYRHIYVTGFENIPASGPVIIIANHNSSLMDAALLGILLKRRAWFFARGDVFVNKAIQTFLWWMHMMPVHSHQGGRNTLKANKNSFTNGRQILLQGGIIVFFPESFSHIEHQLLPFRKGVFRLAFDAAEAGNFSTDIPVVPVGITYDHPVAGRTSAAVHAGKPLLLSDYINEYKKNPPAALLHICKDAHHATARLVLHVAEFNRLETAGRQLTICRNNHPPVTPAWKIASNHQLAREQAICQEINNSHPAAFESKQSQAVNYFNALSANGLLDKTVTDHFYFPFWKKILLVAGFPFYLLGLLLNGLPVGVARLVVNKTVYRKDFYSWIFVACYSFKYFFWLVALLAITFILWGWPFALGLLVVMVTTGLFAYAYKDWLADWRQQQKRQSLGTARLNELAAMRRGIYSAAGL